MKQWLASMAGIDVRGLWDHMAHCMDDQDHRSQGGSMVDQGELGPMRSGPRLGHHPLDLHVTGVSLRQKRVVCRQGLWDPSVDLIKDQNPTS